MDQTNVRCWHCNFQDKAVEYVRVDGRGAPPEPVPLCPGCLWMYGNMDWIKGEATEVNVAPSGCSR